MPGPQVRTRPRQLDVATMHGYPGSRVVSGQHQMSQGCHQGVISSPVSRDGAGSHVYMEVDPLYSTFAPSTLYMGGGQGLTQGLVSSTSSQTSSGYSTAPSDTQRLSGLGTNLYECEEAEYETSQETRGGYNISQASCEFHQNNHRSSQRREKRPELVMNNILLQQTNREVL